MLGIPTIFCGDTFGDIRRQEGHRKRVEGQIRLTLLVTLLREQATSRRRCIRGGMVDGVADIATNCTSLRRGRRPAGKELDGKDMPSWI